jgi:UDP-glucose 4-epimerase
MAANATNTGQIFNIGSGSTNSINTLVELIGGSKVNIPKRPGEPDCTYADISKIGGELGWSPSVSLVEGVTQMLNVIEEWRDAPVWDENKIEQATRKWFEYLG